MSYRLLLVSGAPGADPLTAARSWLAAEPPRLTPAAPAQQRERILAALTAHQPALRLASVAPDHDMLAEDDRASGIEINLFSDATTIKLPYWHTGPAAQPALQQMWACCAVIQAASGSAIYDPQLSRILDLAADFAAVLARYTAIVEQQRGAP